MEILSHLAGGGSIEFSIAVEAARGPGAFFDLRLKSARRMAENAAVLLAQYEPCTKVLNIDTDLSVAEDL